MPFKINISTKDGKTYKLETEASGLLQKELGQTVQGADVMPELAGYELKITGASDKSGFTALEEVPGQSLNRVLLTQGKGMKNKPKGESKKPVSTPNGLRMRKTVRGRVISEDISQVNTQVVKEGAKSLAEVFPDQNKAPEPEPTPEAPKAEEPKGSEEAPAQEKAEEKAEEKPVEAAPEEQEPKESEASKEEKANPEEEPSA